MSAEELKAEGNKLFLQKSYSLAATKYTEAIALDKTNAILYSNRAACYLSLGQYLDASSDAREATQLDPSYTKGWVRLATAFGGLSIKNASIDAWKKAIETLPKDGSVSTAQLKEYEGKLCAAEELRDSATSQHNIMKRGASPPWVLAENLLNSREGATLRLSSSMVMVQAYAEFSGGVKLINQFKMLGMTNEGPKVFGNPNSIISIAAGIMTDERVFHIAAENNWYNKYNDQAKFEVAAIGAQEYWNLGPQRLIEKAQEIQRQSGWNKVRPLLSKIVHLWFMNGFLTQGFEGNYTAAHKFYKSIIEILTWGRSAWKDVPYEQKGNMFKLTFLWKIQAFDLDSYPSMTNAFPTQDDPARIKLLEEMYEEAEELIKDLDANPIVHFSDPLGGNTTMYIAYYLNCKASALSTQGYYHKHIALIEKDSDVACEHLHKAALKYEQAAMTLVQDDERRPFFLGAALDCLWRSGKGTYRQTTTWMHEFRASYHEMIKIWLNSGTPLIREDHLAQIMKIEEEALEKLSTGEATPDSIHHCDGFKFN